MRTLTTLRLFLVIALSCLSTALSAAITLTPVVSGLASPVFVGNAGDGSNRLFIIEQAGIIKVLQTGSSAPTAFLDIRTKILSGGERGLLGLAFHPQYATNGRFFVYYTRTGDGTIVIAEYGVSGNPNVANTTETILLTIPHPNNSNHNGGMLAFGSEQPTPFLYAGVGDGGSGNDPPNNAQNINTLLGKILRIDVDHPDSTAGTAYSSPANNPYVGMTGRDEIFSIGWRNPWRFSFDRLTKQQWVADVGQGTREEVDTPIVLGGNYGWRVYEGFNCTGVDQSLCNPANYIPPIFDYAHGGGRCSITGGYVYRGTAGALPQGTYVYGDYCTGEIFAWDGSTQSVLLDTTMSISSFGEDEAGEHYVVNLGGSVSRIAAVGCTFDITPPSQGFGTSGGTGSVNVTASAGCAWTAVANPNAPWVHITSGASGNGNGAVGYSVDANTSTSSRSTNLSIAGRIFTVSQMGACTYDIAPTSQNIAAGGGTGTVGVTAGAGCAWTAVSNPNAPWVHITSGASGSGNGTVGYSVDANTSTSLRSTNLTIAGKTFTVSQAAAACTYDIAPTSQSFAAAGGTGSVAVTAGSGCAWTAVANPNAPWVRITSGASGSGNGSVGYSVDANTSSSSRQGTVTIAGRTFTVNQSGAVSCTFSISPTSASYKKTGGTGSVNVTAPAGCGWTAVSNATTWITITNGASGSGNGVVSYSVGSYGGPANKRNGTITIAGKTFSIDQTKK